MKKLLSEKEKSQRQALLQLVLQELGFKNIRAFQKANGLTADGIVGINTYRALYAKYLNAKEVAFEGFYHKQTFDKKQIVLHHSAGWDNARLMFDIWKRDNAHHVATAIGITDSGEVIRGYDEAYWAVHIGAYEVGLSNFLQLETQSIGVEICNWGALETRNNMHYTWVGDYGKRGQGVTLPQDCVIELNYKGCKFYEAYTKAEIESTRRWIMLNAIRFDIPLAYNEADFWEVSKNATSGKAGLYTHNSYVSWKTDVSPQPKLIAMLSDFNDIK
jgi:N-acetylmuramoyl-L-alanine amidase/Putative peptidoglycan binding domain